MIREQRESVTLLHDLPTEEVLSIIDRYAEIAKLSPDAVVSFTPFPILAAEEYVKRQVRLDRVPTMIETGLHQAKLEQKYQLDPELTSRVGGLHHRYTWDAVA